MGENTRIEWADHTFNPWTGCTKVSPACDHCYAEGWAKRSGQVQWGAGQPRRRTSVANWKQPLKWDRQAMTKYDAWKHFKAANPGLTDAQLQAQGFIKPQRPRVFCGSLADVFDNDVPPEWRIDLFNLIISTPYLDWLLLTKRIGNAATMINELLPAEMKALPTEHPLAWPWPHVWIGATICNQAEAARDIPKLLSVPASNRFVSIEPLLGPVDLGLCDCDHGSRIGPGGVGGVSCAHCGGAGGHMVDWVIVGGESGPQARPMHPDWVRSLRDQCASAGVPFLFKQWGEWVPRSACYHTFTDGTCCSDIDPGATRWPVIRLTERGNNGRDLTSAADGGDDAYMQRVGKKMAGRLLDGIEHNAFPEHIA